MTSPQYWYWISYQCAPLQLNPSERALPSTPHLHRAEASSPARGPGPGMLRPASSASLAPQRRPLTLILSGKVGRLPGGRRERALLAAPRAGLHTHRYIQGVRMDSQGETEAIVNHDSAVSARDSGTAVAWIGDHHAGQVARGVGNRYRTFRTVTSAPGCPQAARNSGGTAKLEEVCGELPHASMVSTIQTGTTTPTHILLRHQTCPLISM
jgi:hypothetical protein